MNADGTITRFYDASATEVMKEQLMQKRAVAIGYFADASRPWDTGGEGHYMSAETWAVYTYEYGGFYMEYLQGLLPVQEGQSYSVVVKQVTPNGTHMMNAPGGYGQNSRLIAMGMFNQYAKSVVNPGESLLYQNGAWHDWSDRDFQLAASEIDPAGDPFDMQFDNFPIKGYTLQRENDLQVRLADGVESVLLYVGDDPMTLALELFGGDAADNSIEALMFDWRHAEGGDGLVSLEGIDEAGHATLSGL